MPSMMKMKVVSTAPDPHRPRRRCRPRTCSKRLLVASIGVAAALVIVATLAIAAHPTAGTALRAGVHYTATGDAALLEELAVPSAFGLPTWMKVQGSNSAVRMEMVARMAREAAARGALRKRLLAVEDAKASADASEYRAALKRCIWVDEGRPDAALTKFGYVQLNGAEGWKRKEPTGMISRRCTVSDKLGGKWVIRRVGPMAFHGGGDFKMLAWTNPGDLIVGKDQLLSGWTARPVLGDGTPIDFPPLHVHHAHLNPAMNVLDPSDGVGGQYIEVSQRGPISGGEDSLNWLSASVLTDAIGISSGDTLRGLDRATGRAAQLHGDNLCTREHGGSDCYIHLHNRSEGLRIKTTLSIDLVFEDVRPKDISPLLTDVWAEVMVRSHPIDAQHLELGFDRLAILPHFPLDRFITYRAPTDQYSVSVGTGTFKSSGLVVEHRVHSHRRATNATWVVIGARPDELGWAKWRWPAVVSVEGMILPNAMKVVSLDPTKAMVLAHVSELKKRGRDLTLCLDDGDQTSHVFESAEVKYDGWYDRYSELMCDEWRMTKGGPWTVISFNQPPKRNPTKRTWWPQHTTVYLKWRADAGEQPVNNVAFEDSSAHMRATDPPIDYKRVST